MKYRCKVQKNSGEIEVILVSASSAIEAAESLKKQDLIVISSTIDTISLLTYKKVKLRELIFFFSNTAMLLGAGLPIVDVLNISVEQTKEAHVKELIKEIATDVNNGNSFYESVKKHKEFPELVSALIKVGETTGKLKENLEMISVYYDKRYKTINKVKSALTYPMMTITIAFGAIYVVSTQVLPKIKNIVPEDRLQITTKILLAISNFLIKYQLYPFVIAGLLIFGLNKYFNKYAKLQKDSVILKLPLFGNLIKKNIMVQFSSTLSTLLGSGVSIIESLDILTEVIGNEAYKKNITYARDQVLEGKQLSKVLSQDLFDRVLLNVIDIGERTGNVKDALKNLSNYLNDELDNTTKRLTDMIMPLSVVVVGGFVAMIALGILMPIYSMYQNVNI